MAAYRKLNRFVPNESNTIDDITGFKVKTNQVMRDWRGLYMVPEAWSIRQPQDFAPNIIPTKIYPNVRTEQGYVVPSGPCPPDPAPGNVLRSTEDFGAAVWQGTAGVTGQYDNVLNFPTIGDYLEQTYSTTVEFFDVWTGYFVISGYGTITVGVGSPEGSPNPEESVQQVILGAEQTIALPHIFLNAQTGVRAFIERRAGDSANQVTVGIVQCNPPFPFTPPVIV